MGTTADHPLSLPIGRSRRLGVAAALGVAVGVAMALVGGSVGASLVSAGEAQAEPPRKGHPPDPPSVPSTKQWVFDVRVDKGVVSIERVRSVQVKNPEATARVMGRFALELWIGTELLDRIRFNVPIGADLPREDDGRPFRRPSFDKVTTRFAVKMADHPRAVFAVLVDRATDTRTKYRWPPTGESLELFHPPKKPDAGPAPSPDAGPAPSPDAGPAPSPDAGPPGPPPDAGPSPDGGPAPPPAPDAG